MAALSAGLLRRGVCLLGAALLVLSGMVLTMVVEAPRAEAIKATGGSGRFVDSIEWFSWGSNNQALPRTGVTRTQTFTSAGQTVAVTCRIGPVTGGGGSETPLEAYRSGNWKGDGLDELYNIGGPNGANKLVNAVSNREQGTTPTFDFSCSATLNGAPLPLAGLVMADAEQSGGNEYVQATIPSGATWRIIDRYRSSGCTQQSNAIRTDQTLRLQNPAASATCSAGPMAVAFMDGTSSATNVQVAGGGKSAIALGVAIDFDFGDAPASYGVAGHGLQRSYAGGEVPQGTTGVSGDDFALASPDVPAARLGATVDAEGSQLTSADALGDDTDGVPDFGGPDDEDSTSFPASVVVTPGASYSQTVACTGSQAVAGWIDFARDGTFGGTDRSATATCAGGAATLTWAVPATGVAAGDQATFARIRSAVAAGDVANATGVAPNGEVEDYAITIRRPSLELTKTGVANDLDGNGTDAGDTITYAFTVTNTGPTVLDDVQVADPRVGGAVTCGTGPLAAGASRACSTATYTIVQSDIDGGSVTNTATATAQPPTGNRVSDDDTVTTRTPANPRLSIDKTAGPVVDANGNGRVDAGDTITYSFAVANTGNQPLTSVGVSDPKVGPVTCTPTTLQPGASATCGTRTYTLTQADVQAGGVDNTAVVTGTKPGGGQVTDRDSTSTALTRAPSLLLDKSAATPVDANGSGRTDAGDTIAYTFTVTNTGNTTVSNLTIADPKVGTAACIGTVLDPDASTTCQATYTITQDDADTGSVDNRATANASSPGSDGVVSNVDTTATPVSPAPGLEIAKTAGTPVDVDGDGRVDAGDTIDYSFSITNTGSVTIRNLVVVDAKTGGANCPITRLAPGATTSTPCTKTYTITQADVDSGTVDNSATARGAAPDGSPVDSEPDTTSTPTSTVAALTVDKAVVAVTDADGDGTVDTGDTVQYSFTVVNTGARTLTDVTIDDNLVTGITCDSSTLAPGARTTCRGSHTITQAEVNAGTVDNTATATATPPGGGLVRSAPDSTSTPTSTTESLSLLKRAGTPVDVDGDDRIAANDTIEYTFEVTNTGARTVSSIAIDDSLVGATSCDATSLDAGESTTCTGTHTITQAEVDAGTVENTATAVGQDPDGDPVTSNLSSTSTEVDTVAALSLDKSVASTDDVNDNDLLDADDTITYTFVVTNTGVVTTRFVGITDPKTGGASCPATTLAPGQSVTCEQTYTLTQADTDAGSVANTATATAQTPDGDPVTSPPDSTITDTDQTSSLTIDKAVAGTTDVDADGTLDVDDTIDYSFLVTNTGTVTITALAVDDDKLATISCPVTALAPGRSTTCTGSYTITQDDEDTGSVDNTARATGQGPDGDVASPDDSVSTGLDADSGLTLDKQAGPVQDTNTSGGTDAGDTIDYTFDVENTGRITLRQLSIVDPKVGAVSCPVSTLAPGATTRCTATYTLTQADLDTGSVDNTAYARTRTTTDEIVRSPDDSTTTTLTTTATLSLDKRAGQRHDTDADGAPSAGDTIDYTFAITNTGVQTITNLSIDDPKVGTVSCPTSPLAPAASTTCTATYTITGADIRAGTVDNTATALGDGPDGGPIVSPPDSTSTPVPTVPALSVDKQADLVDTDRDGRPDEGESIEYRFVVTNTGGIDVTDVAVRDTKLDRAGIAIRCPRTSLAPGESTTCRVTYPIPASEDGENIRNTATVTGGSAQGGVDSPPSTAVVPDDDGTGPGGDGTGPGGDDPDDDSSGFPLPGTGGPAGLWLAGGITAIVLGTITLARERRRRRA